jgi:integrase
MPQLFTLTDSVTGHRKYLNKEERKAFFTATQLQEAKIKYLSQFIYYTGCRLSEALEVTPARLDYANKTVTIRTLKQGTRNGEQVIRYRSNELPESFLNELQGVYNMLKLQGSPKTSDRPLWPVTDRTARKYVKQVMEVAEIVGKHATPRGLRHSMGVSLAMNKVPANIIQKVLGHASEANTMVYLDVVQDERRELVSQVW